jgi:hypothetical protein
MEIYFKRIIPILIICLFAFTVTACGTTDQTQRNEKQQEGKSDMNHNSQDSKGIDETNGNKGIVAGSIVPSATVTPINKNGVSIVYSLKNQTEKVKELTFSTSQKFDYILTKEDGTVIERYSEDKSFLQVVTFISLKQGETFEIPVRLSNLEDGKYFLSIWLTSNSENEYKVKIPFEIPLN